MKGLAAAARWCGVVVLGLMVGRAWGAQGGGSPNVVIVLVDDQGYGDLGCHGNPTVRTPELDRLWAESVRLTDFHVAPMCTPTRSQLMTGQDALRNGGMNVSSGREMMRRGVATLPEVLKGAGYRTGIFGKWHLGDVYPHRPQDRGFERAMWFRSSYVGAAADRWGNDYFDTWFWHEDGAQRQAKGYVTDVIFDEAMGWMRERGEKGERFFAYVALNAAHAPLFVPDKYREPYRALGREVASFYGMIANIDENVGRLEGMLRETGLRENTVLIYMTDNGGTAGVRHFNAGMKAGKVTLWDGGHRVPCFVRWPAGGVGGSSQLPVPGSPLRREGEDELRPYRGGAGRDVGELTQVQDWMPTLMEWCGAKGTEGMRLDGVSLAGVLAGKEERLGDRMCVVQFSRMDRPVPEKWDSTVMWGKWRLWKGEALYDVSKDLGQERDVAKEHPEVVERMRGHYERWWAEVGQRAREEYVDIVVGSEREQETALTAADWRDVFLDQQEQVRAGVAKNGRWGIEVAWAGEYEFELRRWPREADAGIGESVAEWRGVDGGTAPEGAAGVRPGHVAGPRGRGRALPAKRAKLWVGGEAREAEVREGEKQVRFVVPLGEGRAEVRTAFVDETDGELCGAYYVYVRRREK